MRLKRKHKKAQAIVEYALIAATVILVLVGATKGLAIMMRSQSEGTAQGLSSKSYMEKND
ncbi:MAG: hypothetical protein AABZ74_19055 [Cyanobacteriota bacterium]